MAEVMSQETTKIERHFDVLRHNSDGGVLLGCSNLTGPIWGGSLYYYKSSENCFSNVACFDATIRLRDGICDGVWINEHTCLVGTDSGGLNICTLRDDFSVFELSYSHQEHDDRLVSVDVDCSKSKAISGSYDRCIKIWDLESHQCVQTYKAHTDHVFNVAFHPKQSDIFLSCSNDGRILTWDLRKPKPANCLDKSPLTTIPTSIAWQPESDHTVAIGDEVGSVVVTDTRISSSVDEILGQTGPLMSTPHNRQLHKLVFSPQTPTMLASLGDDCKVIVSSIEPNELKKVYESCHGDMVRGASWCPNTADSLYTCGWDSTVKCHNLNEVTNSTHMEVHAAE